MVIYIGLQLYSMNWKSYTRQNYKGQNPKQQRQKISRNRSYKTFFFFFFWFLLFSLSVLLHIEKITDSKMTSLSSKKWRNFSLVKKKVLEDRLQELEILKCTTSGLGELHFVTFMVSVALKLVSTHVAILTNLI